MGSVPAMLVLLTFLLSTAALSTADLTQTMSFTLERDESATSASDICDPLGEINLSVSLNRMIAASKSTENGKYKIDWAAGVAPIKYAQCFDEARVKVSHGMEEGNIMAKAPKASNPRDVQPFIVDICETFQNTRSSLKCGWEGKKWRSVWSWRIR